MWVVYSKKPKEIEKLLTRSVDMPPIVAAVIQLTIDHFRLNHHVTLLRQMVKLAPRSLMQLTVLVGRSLLQLYLLYLTIDHLSVGGFLDPNQIKQFH